MNVAPTEANILAALRSFLLGVLPAGVEVIEGQDNRVAAPVGLSYAVMWPPQYERLETNVDSAADVTFIGSIAGATMTVTGSGGSPSSTFGTISVGATVFGVNVAANTVITALGSGTGGNGTYTVSVPQTVGSETLSSGAKSLTQAAQATVQIDFHAADGTSGDMAQAVSTAFRDEYATDQFANQSPNYGVAPLYADDPRQTPWQDDQQQIEWKWTLDAHLQANQVLSVPQQYASAAQVTLISVDATYPP